MGRVARGNDQKGAAVSTLFSLSTADVTAREYGRGLGYPPGVTIFLASIIIAACALAVVGHFAIKLSWWRQDHKRGPCPLILDTRGVSMPRLAA
jgi:hypothetical protein